MLLLTLPVKDFFTASRLKHFTSRSFQPLASTILGTTLAFPSNTNTDQICKQEI